MLINNTVARSRKRFSVIGVTAAGTWGSDGKPNFGLVTRLDAHRAFIRLGLVQAGAAHANETGGN